MFDDLISKIKARGQRGGEKTEEGLTKEAAGHEDTVKTEEIESGEKQEPKRGWWPAAKKIETAKTEDEGADEGADEELDIKIDLPKLAGGFLTAIYFLFPVFFLTFTTDWFESSKIYLIYLSVGVLGLWYLAGNLKTKSVRYTRTPFDLPVALLVLAAVLPAFAAVNRNLVLSASAPLTGLVLFYFLMVRFLNTKEMLNRAEMGFVLGAAVLGLMSIFQMILKAAGLNCTLPAALTGGVVTNCGLGFSPAGSYLAQAYILAAALTLLLPKIAGKIGKKERNFGLALTLTVVLGLLVTIYGVFSRPLGFLPQAEGWAISTGVLRESPLLGLGAGNFINAFTRFRTLSFNVGQNWNLRYGISSNYYFQVLSESGLLGLTAWVLLIVQLVRTNLGLGGLKNRREKTGNFALNLFLLLVFVSLILMPASFALLGTIFLFLILISARLRETGMVEDLTLRLVTLKEGLLKAEEWRESEVRPRSSWILVGLTTILGLWLLAGGGLVLARNYLADHYYKKSLVATAANNGGLAYNELLKAMDYNPSNDNYRASYSQINLALANNLAARIRDSKAATGSSEAVALDQDRNTVSQLVQQAIREARNAAGLNPGKVGNWENLALIYQNLINFAEGADQFTVASYNQAITVDPLNPRLRLDLGGVFYGRGLYADAQRQFELAAQLKPDYANAHYNLSQALLKQNKKSEAGRELESTRNLVCQIAPDGEDCRKANKELKELTDELAKNQQSGGTGANTLPSAETTPTPVLSPTPSLRPTSTPKPTVTPKPTAVVGPTAGPTLE